MRAPQRLVARDRGQPWPRMLRPVAALPVAPRPQDRVLGDVLRVVGGGMTVRDLEAPLLDRLPVPLN